MNENELMQKLALSKAIMDKSNLVRNTKNIDYNYNDEDANFDIPQAKYNIPSEYMTQQPMNESFVSNPIKAVGTPTVDAIKNSKLPDEIKRIMIEHPIVQPNMNTNPVLSDDLVERATKLMGTQKQTKQPTQGQSQRQNVSEGIDYNKIQKMIEVAVTKALNENGMIAESTEKSNESFQFKVGKHIFEGKVTKIKKIP